MEWREGIVRENRQGRRMPLEGDGEPENRTCSWSAVSADSSTHQLDDLPGDGQSQNRAAIFPRDRSVRLTKGAKSNGTCSSEKPIPVSFTLNRKVAVC